MRSDSLSPFAISRISESRFGASIALKVSSNLKGSLVIFGGRISSDLRDGNSKGKGHWDDVNG
jgi:hypothetical protein